MFNLLPIRLVNACNANNVPIETEAIVPLLLSVYFEIELKQLIAVAQKQCQERVLSE